MTSQRTKSQNHDGSTASPLSRPLSPITVVKNTATNHHLAKILEMNLKIKTCRLAQWVSVFAQTSNIF
ncbi:hypothetical protein D8674_009644 [Pyrus ussuriensis x Pyrus communis]|uniref:Uncharacterized protein n=1 Tax=Pyrus ussuriensis x Pyrus communis TaxID=2448454 RepID=A0A5N5F995_9ROSA|nr:hypothetical protein D8674_009644 [Pyrus ussuriensis x Pyrus communis]